MYYIITQKEDNTCLNWDTSLSYNSVGYPTCDNKKIVYVDYAVNVYEGVKEVPEDIPEKYCYTPESGFYPNPDYHEPDVYDRVLPEDALEIEANYTSELLKEGVL